MDKFRYECRAFGHTDDDFPYEFLGFGDMDCQFPYEFIGFGAMDCQFRYELQCPQTLRVQLRGVADWWNLCRDQF